MSLVFVPTCDGFRVEKNGLPLAALKTKDIDHSPSEVMPSEAFNKLQAEVGVDKALEARDQWTKDRVGKVTCYVNMPVADCTVHGCGGPLSVADLHEMLAYIQKTNK